MTRELRARPSAPVIRTSSIPCLVGEGEPVPKNRSYVQIEPAYRLPTDPTKLAQTLARGALAHDPEGATGAAFLLAGGQILSDPGPLMGKPVTPEMRAAVFRAIADLPGFARWAPSGTRWGGRESPSPPPPDESRGRGELDRWLIIDPATGSLLALEDVALTASTSSQWARPGSPVRWTAVVQAGWTVQGPPEHAR